MPWALSLMRKAKDTNMPLLVSDQTLRIHKDSRLASFIVRNRVLRGLPPRLGPKVNTLG